MRSAEIAKLLDVLHGSAAELKDAVVGLPEGLADRRPSPDCWSVLGILEHLVVIENLISDRFANSPRRPESIANQEREEQIFGRVQDRSSRVMAPEVGWPAGRFANIRDAFAAFDDGRKKLEHMIIELGPELRQIEMQHPVLGTISGYEMLLVLAAHAIRHAKQIVDVKTTLAKGNSPN